MPWIEIGPIFVAFVPDENIGNMQIIIHANGSYDQKMAQSTEDDLMQEL